MLIPVTIDLRTSGLLSLNALSGSNSPWRTAGILDVMWFRSIENRFWTLQVHFSPKPVFRSLNRRDREKHISARRQYVRNHVRGGKMSRRVQGLGAIISAYARTAKGFLDFADPHE